MHRVWTLSCLFLALAGSAATVFGVLGLSATVFGVLGLSTTACGALVSSATTEPTALPEPAPTPDAQLSLEDLQPETPLQPGAGPNQGRLVVRIQKIRSPRGNLWVHLFSAPAGFPDLKRARQMSVAKRASNYAEAVFNNLPYGAYALVAYHDEDNNLKLTKTWLGMNREGVGVSNNPVKSNFANARFEFDAPEVCLLIDLVYPGGQKNLEKPESREKAGEQE